MREGEAIAAGHADKLVEINTDLCCNHQSRRKVEHINIQEGKSKQEFLIIDVNTGRLGTLRLTLFAHHHRHHIGNRERKNELIGQNYRSLPSHIPIESAHHLYNPPGPQG